jgi:hypothetical protein
MRDRPNSKSSNSGFLGDQVDYNPKKCAMAGNNA